MKAQFVNLQAAADFMGPGALEIDRYQTEITDIVRRRGVFGQRIKNVPATGHPSRYFEETAIPAPTAANAFVDPRSIVPTLVAPTGVERSVPLKCLVSQINYNLFDIELGQQQSQFAYLQAKDLADTVDGVLRTHDVALWNGTDTSLSSPTTAQYFGAAGQIAAGGNTVSIGTSQSIVDGFKSTIAQMVANSSYGVRPTAIYANPVLLDLIDREMKAEFNVVLNTDQITGGVRVKMLSTQAGDLPLIPDWSLSYTGTPGSGSAGRADPMMGQEMGQGLAKSSRAHSGRARSPRWLLPPLSPPPSRATCASPIGRVRNPRRKRGSFVARWRAARSPGAATMARWFRA